VAVVVLLALLVGGLTQVSTQSQGYHTNSDRSLAAQGGVVATQSNATASQVRRLLTDLSTQTRQTIQAGLDSAVEQTAGQADRAALAAGSAAPGSAAAQFAAAFAERAQSLAQLRTAVDGFLGMRPTQPAGAPSTDATNAAAGGTVSLTADQATNRIAAVGAMLARSDSLYRSARRTLAAASGHARLPASVWVTDAQLWQPGNVASDVDLLATSPTLITTHYLLLRTVRLDPPALPAPQGTPAGVSVLSPTSQVGVTAVLANNGSADEPHASVRFTLADQSSGTTATRVESAGLMLGASVTLPTVVFGVTPGTSYALTVAVVLPAGQGATAGTVLQQVLQVAPGTEPRAGHAG
jgi:hypothetical protein